MPGRPVNDGKGCEPQSSESETPLCGRGLAHWGLCLFGLQNAPVENTLQGLHAAKKASYILHGVMLGNSETNVSNGMDLGELDYIVFVKTHPAFDCHHALHAGAFSRIACLH